MLPPKTKEPAKKEAITITNDKDRLSQADIDRMVKEAEEAADEDKKTKERVEARNSLENYAYSVRNSINDKEKLGAKLSEEDRLSIETALKDSLDFLESNQQAEKEEYDATYKELEKVVQPIFTKLYQATGGAPPSAESQDMPEHDEL